MFSYQVLMSLNFSTIFAEPMMHCRYYGVRRKVKIFSGAISRDRESRYILLVNTCTDNSVFQ